MIMDGDMNDWMAGGMLYDSPRAGDLFFNPTGDLNTVRFLGLEDNNNRINVFKTVGDMPKLHEMLGVTAGSKNY
jgi:hypothetical protein